MSTDAIENSYTQVETFVPSPTLIINATTSNPAGKLPFLGYVTFLRISEQSNFNENFNSKNNGASGGQTNVMEPVPKCDEKFAFKCPNMTDIFRNSEANEFADTDEEEDERDLTNLTWLTQLRNQAISLPNRASHEESSSSTEAELLGIGADGGLEKFCKAQKRMRLGYSAYKSSVNGAMQQQQVTQQSQHQQQPQSQAHQHQQPQTQPQQIKRPTPAERYELFLKKIKRDFEEYQKSAINYQTDTTEKPPFNYSHIIGMAMLENGRVTLQQICSWIEEKFAFFRVRKKWNNSIRHNLSLHHCFRKIDRNKYEKGKGGYWELGMDPKKCDRKRIRNRKSSQNKNKQISSMTVEAPQKSITPNDLGANECREETLILDDLDIQENIHISSCSHQKLQDTVLIGDLLDGTGGEFPQQCPTSSSDMSKFICNTEQVDQQHLQQYQLGTIIISTTANTELASATAFNCLINDNLVYTKDDELNAPENVVITEGGGIAEFSIDANKIYNSQRPNVIVEQLEQLANGTPITIAQSNPNSTSISSSSHTADYANIVNDNFRPYVDGIEEAFQYLRSMDNNREDLLDNLLDISVSDY